LTNESLPEPGLSYKINCSYYHAVDIHVSTTEHQLGGYLRSEFYGTHI